MTPIFLTPEQRRERFRAERTAFADDYCGGDTGAADAILDALPYSDIPDWGDARRAVEAIHANVMENR